MSGTDIDRYQRPAIADVLTRAGVDTGAQPWHDTPSGWRRGPCPVCHSGNRRGFAYREDTGRWRCFDCDTGGNVWDLVMTLEHCDFDSAVAMWRSPVEPAQPAESVAHDRTLWAGDVNCPACQALKAAGVDAWDVAQSHG